MFVCLGVAGEGGWCSLKLSLPANQARFAKVKRISDGNTAGACCSGINLVDVPNMVSHLSFFTLSVNIS